MLMHIKMSTSNMREIFLVLLGLYVDDCMMMSNDITLFKFHIKISYVGIQITKDQIERID
jgi:hypothetical protein